MLDFLRKSLAGSVTGWGWLLSGDLQDCGDVVLVEPLAEAMPDGPRARQVAVYGGTVGGWL